MIVIKPLTKKIVVILILILMILSNICPIALAADNTSNATTYTTSTSSGVAGKIQTPKTATTTAKNIATVKVYKSSEVAKVINWSTVTTKDTVNAQLNALTPVASAQTNNNGTYEITVEPGVYDILIDKTGYLDAIYTSVSVKTNSITQLGEKTLVAGDADKNGIINNNDIILLQQSNNATSSDSRFNESCDLDNNGTINNNDLVIVYQNNTLSREIIDVENTSVSLNLVAGENVESVTGSGLYEAGETVEISAKLAEVEGYTIKWDGWESSNTDLIENQSEQTVSIVMPTEDITLTANATKEATEYAINYELNGGKLSGNYATTYTIESEDITLPIPTKEGYGFKGWTGSNGTTPQTNVTIAKGSTGDKTYTANWRESDLEISQTNITLDLSGTKTAELTATVASGTEIYWETDNSEVATISASTGNTITVMGRTNGTAIITATANGITKICNVTVKTSATGLSINKTSATLDLTGTKTVELSASILPSTVSTDLTWASSNPEVATVSAETGSSITVTGISNGTATITASIDGIEQKCKVTVQTTPTGVVLNKTSETLNISGNNTVQLEASFNPATSNVSTGLTWTSSNTSVATVDSTGLVSAVANGTATITVETENKKTATCEITVHTTAKEMTLNEEEVTLDMSGTRTFELIASLNPATSDSIVSWKTNNAAVVSLSATTGNSIIVTGVANGTATITAEVDGLIKTCDVTVHTTPTGVTLDKTTATLDMTGTKTVQLNATIDPELANASTDLTWSTGNVSVATVNSTGLVTAIANGTTMITVSTANGKTATCEVTVQTTATDISLNKETATLDLSGIKTVTLNAITTPTTTTPSTLIWNCSDPTVASISATTGKSIVVTGLKNGTATVAVASNGIIKTCNITVQTSPDTVTLNKETATLDLSGTKTLQLTTTIAPNTTDVNTELTWTSSDETVAKVSDEGLVTALKNGTTVITVETANGRTDTCVVTVQTTPTGVILDTTTATLDMTGTQTLQLNATIIPSSANASTTLSWTSSDNSVATVSNAGLVTAKANGTATITVTTGNGKKATCEVTVQTTTTGVSLDKTTTTLDLSGTKTVQLKATLAPTTANIGSDLTWSSNATDIATVSTSGLVTAKANGKATITVTTANGKTATCVVTVQTTPTGVALNKTSATLDMSGTKTVQLSTTIAPATANASTGITWTSSNTAAATVSTSGLVTAVANGTTTITAKTANGKTATCAITVQTTTTGVTLNKTTASLDLSGTKTVSLTATVAPGAANIGNAVSWSTSSSSIAKLSATTGNTVTVTGVANGTATITATTANGKKATCTVTVTTTPTGVTLNKTSATLDLSGTKTVQLSTTIAPTTANTSTGITWTSSNTAAATVSTSGLVTAKANGTTTITAKTANGKTATCAITVQTTPTGVTLNQTTATLDLSGTKTVKLTATVAPGTANASNTVSWSTSSGSIAKLSATSGTSVTVTGVANGTATITATVNGKSATCKVTVQTTPTGVTLNKTTASVVEGKTLQLTATIAPTTANANKTVSWTSSKTSVATVSNTGLVTAVAAGTTTITATTGNGKTATCTVTVNSAVTTITFTRGYQGVGGGGGGGQSGGGYSSATVPAGYTVYYELSGNCSGGSNSIKIVFDGVTKDSILNKSETKSGSFVTNKEGELYFGGEGSGPAGTSAENPGGGGGGTCTIVKILDPSGRECILEDASA